MNEANRIAYTSPSEDSKRVCLVVGSTRAEVGVKDGRRETTEGRGIATKKTIVLL